MGNVQFESIYHYTNKKYQPTKNINHKLCKQNEKFGERLDGKNHVQSLPMGIRTSTSCFAEKLGTQICLLGRRQTSRRRGVMAGMKNLVLELREKVRKIPRKKHRSTMTSIFKHLTKLEKNQI